MPETLNRVLVRPWQVGEFPRTAGTRHMYSKLGFKTKKGENPLQVLKYDGRCCYGSTLRYAPFPGMPTNAWYAPDPFTTQVPYTSTFTHQTNERRRKAINRAYAKFKDKAIGEGSQMGTFIAEGREAYGMIRNRAAGLYRAYRALRRGRFKQFLRELGVKPKRKHRSVVRTAAGEASGLWLEYWFGWSPTIKDMYRAYEILTGVHNYKRCHGAGGTQLPLETTNSGGVTNRLRVESSGELRVKMGATVELVNFNTAVRTSLGLTNPLAVAWELVPFSFVVDWFTQFGNSINALTDFAGFALHNAYTSIYQKCKVVWKTWNQVYGGEGYNGTYEYTVFQQERRQGITYPLVLRPRLALFGSSVTRTATAVSLLTAIFLDR